MGFRQSTCSWKKERTYQVGFGVRIPNGRRGRLHRWSFCRTPVHHRTALPEKTVDNAVKDCRKRLHARVSANGGKFEHVTVRITDTNCYMLNVTWCDLYNEKFINFVTNWIEFLKFGLIIRAKMIDEDVAYCVKFVGWPTRL